MRVNVTANDAAKGELVLPDISAEVAPVPVVGDSPKLVFHHPEGKDGAIEDYRGKYTVVYFWASWCGECKKQLPALRRLQERYTARGLAMLGLSLDHDPAAWQKTLEQLQLPWPQGRLAAAADAGVSIVPVYWLLDPQGKIVAKTYDLDEIAASLADRMR